MLSYGALIKKKKNLTYFVCVYVQCMCVCVHVRMCVQFWRLEDN